MGSIFWYGNACIIEPHNNFLLRIMKGSERKCGNDGACVEVLYKTVGRGCPGLPLGWVQVAVSHEEIAC